jgi:hypothetical protein
MTTKLNRDSEIHAQTAEEITRQLRIHSDRRAQIVNERARIYGSALKGGATPELDPDERASRAHALHLLNGNAPDSLSLPPEISRDRALLREQRGLDLVIRVLSSKQCLAVASEAVIWSENHRDEWCELARDIVLSAIKLDALERRACQLLAQCSDVTAVRLPLVNVIGGWPPVSEIPIGDLVERALAEKVITPAERRKAEG